MPAAPTPTQPDASRPSAPTATRHGLCGRTFFLLPDEAEAEWREHESLLLASLAPRDALEHEAALAVIRAMWREMRADRLEAQVLTDLFAGGRIEDPAEAAKASALKALGTMLRYRGRIEREHRQAMQTLDALRQRQLRRAAAPVPSEPEPPVAVAERAPLPGESEDGPRLNRHQRRALQALDRQRGRLAA